MIAALLKAFLQLNDPRLRRVIVLGVLGAMAAYGLLVAAAWWLIAETTWFQARWADTAGHILAGALALILPLPFFPALATAIMSAMLEKVADAVEERHYPRLDWPRPQKWAEVLATTLTFLGVTLVVNLAALPVYILLLFTGFGAVLLVLVNGYLLGREYFEVVALRRLTPKHAKRLFHERLGKLWLAGAVIYGMFTIPLVNLAAPVIATAFMVHLFQGLQVDASDV